MNEHLKLLRWMMPVLLLLVVGCSSEPGGHPLVGKWRAVLKSPGGELPFGLLIEEQDGHLYAYALNGEERAPFSEVAVNGSQIEMSFAWYDAEIRADLEPLTATSSNVSRTT